MLFVFALLMIVIYVRLTMLAFRLAWGVLAVIGAFVILPIVLIAMAVIGLAHFALPILIIIGIVMFIQMCTSRRKA